MSRSAASAPTIPGYQYVRLLGSGGFSDVFLYDQKFPKRRVAVKVLLTEDLSAATRAAFVAEANLMAQLSAHPYIVTIFQADVAEDDRPYFVMEYCSGASLGDRYKRERFSVADALQIGVRLSSAIATAHSVGILHRDIKPANVLTNDFGWPALTDFGISSAVDVELPSQTTTISRRSGSSPEATTGSASVGMSIPWSPPEMFDDEPKPDVRSDVFSLAATIYTLLAGHTPFEVSGRSNSSVDLVGRIVRGTITPLDRDDIPRSLVAVLQKGMAADRTNRFATAVDFARALQRIELELSYPQTPVDVPNLVVKAPQKADPVDGPDLDETRARSISTVQAQAPLPVIVEQSPIVPSAAPPVRVSPAQAPAAQVPPTLARFKPAAVLPAETIIRPRTEQQVSPPQEAAPARKSKAPLIVGLLVGLAAVIAVVVTVNLIRLPVPADGRPGVGTPGSPEDPSAISGDVVPTPLLVNKSIDGNLVTFTWSNPEPQDGDSFLWQRTDGPVDGRNVVPTSDPSATIADVEPGSTVCITVDIRRQNGETSANPLEECVP